MVTSLTMLQKSIRIEKDNYNKFGKYSYRTAEGILSALKQHMSDDDELIITDEIHEVANELVITAVIKFNGFISKGHAVVDLNHKGMSKEQATGSASSYARKYALQGLLALSDSKDDPDGMENGTEIDTVKFTEEELAALSRGIDTLAKQGKGYRVDNTKSYQENIDAIIEILEDN